MVIDREEAFEERYRELIAFKEEFGHCNFSRTHKKHPSLMAWVDKTIQEDPKGIGKTFLFPTRQDKAIGKDWVPMDTLNYKHSKG